jgi:hypothetical protein
LRPPPAPSINQHVRSLDRNPQYVRVGRARSQNTNEQYPEF